MKQLVVFVVVVLSLGVTFSVAIAIEPVAIAPVAEQEPSGAIETPLSKSMPEGISDDPMLNSRFLLFGSKSMRRKALRWAWLRNNTDMVPALIYALRYHKPDERLEVARVLKRLTGKRYGDDWEAWIRWQQVNEDGIRPFEGFDVFLSALFGGLDPNFRDFIYPGVESSIRLEEILWGGVRAKDGIPPLNDPQLIEADAASFLGEKEWVFGVNINGDARAYPYRFMDWHEMLNDVVGGEPVSLAYCTLCGSGILFKTKIASRDRPLRFGSSGFLYRSNKLMFDKATDSLWNQFTGKPVVGKLVNSGIALETLPLVTTTWGEWRNANPGTRVLGMDTGHVRDYRPGKPYGTYFASSKLMFPVDTDDTRLKQKDEVFGLRLSGAERAWPLKLFRGGKVIHDKIGVVDVVLIGDAKTRSVRAYRTRGQHFDLSEGGGVTRVTSGGQSWDVREAALHGPNGERLSRLPGHLAYWFAWHNYLGSGTLYEAVPD